MNSENSALILLRALTNFGWHDVIRTTEWLDEADVEYGQFADFVSDFCRDTDSPLTGLDLPAMALEYIAERAGASDLRSQIYSNFLCSCFDISEEEAGEILYRVDEEERGAPWRFLVEFTAAIEPETEPGIE
jgi:hypothetical protein